jgi:ferritin-like metal-binding protein YciE
LLENVWKNINVRLSFFVTEKLIDFFYHFKRQFMTNQNKHLVDWLKDAHGMEMQAIKIMENQRSRVKDYPEVAQKLTQHIEVTKRQADRLESCIARYNEKPSTFKDWTSKMAGAVASLSATAAEDEIVKNVIADYAFENFEIASYKSLIAAAEALGDNETAQVCRENLREEEQMCSWIEQKMPQVINQYLTTGFGNNPKR